MTAADIDDSAPPGELAPEPEAAAVELTPAQTARFHTLYSRHFDFVFRNLRRLGVAPGEVDDALQDVFMVVLRRIDDYRDESFGKAWLFAITLRVAGSYRRSQRRKNALSQRAQAQTEPPLARHEPSPFERAAQSEASRFLRDFLDGLDEAKRSVFVLAELEQLSAPEIAHALGVKLNTVYSRIRAARIELSRAISIRTGDDAAEATDDEQ